MYEKIIAKLKKIEAQGKLSDLDFFNFVSFANFALRWELKNLPDLSVATSSDIITNILRRHDG